MTELEVKVPAKESPNYKVQIGTGFIDTLLSQIKAKFPNHRPFIISDENLVGAGLLEVFLNQSDTLQFVIKPAGETSKNINTVIDIIEKMEASYLGRDTLVIALGGGTVGDIGAFAASIFKRGVPVIHIPTTTVSQADSSIGGKTGVDSSKSKNAFGTFWHPAAVYVDVETLKTLDERHYMAGLVESVKHALIADSVYFDYIENNIEAILSRDSDALFELAEKNCRIKASVVEQDPLEKNQRRTLNYGHTIGHAVETLSGYGLLHGEAVAVGIIGAGLIEIEAGLSDGNRLERIKGVFSRLSVPVTMPKNVSKPDVLEILKHDKKAVKGQPRFVLIENIGRVYRRDGQYALGVEQEAVDKALDKLI